MKEPHRSNLTNKAALVTGGSRGIGAAIAKRLAAEGASVAITYSKGADAAASVVDAIKRGLRVLLYKNGKGETCLEYDRPSSL
jgi:3-oxoacyl-[acyl-carrier protein] reductase